MSETAISNSRRRRFLAPLLRPDWAAALYLISLGGVWSAIHWGGDRDWLPTVMMFGPKWIYAAPIVILLPWMAAAQAKRRCWITLAAAILALLFPISRYCIPRALFGGSDVIDLRVLTLNVGGAEFEMERLLNLVKEINPDVVCLQECGEATKGRFDQRWSVRHAGRLLVASRHPSVVVSTVTREAAGRWPRPVCLVVEITKEGRPFQLATVHFLSPRQGLSEITSSRTILAPSRRGTLAAEIDVRRREQSRVHDELVDLAGPVIVAGDFNTPTSSSIYRTCWSTYRNAFSTAGLGFGHTIWVEQGGLHFSARIDQILSTQHWSCLRSWVGPSVGSDHRPLVADFRLDSVD